MISKYATQTTDIQNNVSDVCKCLASQGHVTSWRLHLLRYMLNDLRVRKRKN